jgi:23S rRNA (guanosine2251-2'-O)-methyltransferase
VKLLANRWTSNNQDFRKKDSIASLIFLIIGAMGKPKNKASKPFSIYGLNGAIELLQSEKFQIESIFIQEGSQAERNKWIIDYKKKHDKKMSILSKHVFKNQFSSKRTQGIVVQFSGDIISEELPIFSDEETVCLLVLDQIEDPQNFGQIIRTAECAGVDGILFSKHHSASISDTVLQVSQGAFLNMPLYEVTNLNNEFYALKEQGFWIAGLENSIEAKSWHQIDYKGKIIIIVGSEGEGIREKVLEACDFKATIPMMGKTNSLNVSAAVSAILFERLRQVESGE